MREILFRGERINSGQWVYGFYAKATMHWHKHGIHEDFIVCDAIQNGGYFNFLGRYAVNPKTIGQYTGLTDKNGKKIFEGDIIKCISRFDAKDMVVIFETAEFHLVDCQRYKNYTECCGYRQFGTMETEVIGNIHDNPELLRGDTE